MRKPRPFSLKPIFVDERQEELHALRHSFANAQQRQRKGGGAALSIPMLLSLLLIIAATALVIIYS